MRKVDKDVMMKESERRRGEDTEKRENRCLLCVFGRKLVTADVHFKTSMD